jgi:HK97 family phage major capsid protein
MANSIPLSGATDAAGGVTLPFEQGELFVNGVLEESGALQIAGDSRSVNTRKEIYSIWKGAPTAGFVGEGGTKLATGAEFGAGTATVKKVASIVLFTDEMVEDLQNGDVNVLVDSKVRNAVAKVIDANALGIESGTNLGSTNFDSMLRSTTSKVEYGTGQDALQVAVSAAMGTLESNGYSNFGIVAASDLNRVIRDARQTSGGTAAATAQAQALYQPVGGDPLYGLPRSFSTNLSTFGASAAANKTVAFVVARDNLHVRIRKDVTVAVSKEATIWDGTQNRSMFQENLTALRYETRLAFFVHDINRAVVAIVNES